MCSDVSNIENIYIYVFKGHLALLLPPILELSYDTPLSLLPPHLYQALFTAVVNDNCIFFRLEAVSIFLGKASSMGSLINFLLLQ
jgi:hypothetical protein